MNEAMTDFSAHHEAFQSVLVALSDFIRVDERLSKGLDKGRLAFYGAAEARLLSVSPGQLVDPAKAARFLEWFSLEHPYGESGAAPIHPFLSSGCPGLDQAMHSHARSLAESRVGVYLVKDLDDAGMDLEDAVSGERLSVWLPKDGHSVESGDTLLGRLLPVPETDQYIASSSIERVEGSAVFDAFVEDVERDKLASGDQIQRPVGQLDLELILRIARGVGPTAETETTIQALEESLATLLDGVSPEIPHAEEICDALKESPGPGTLMGPLLETMAFHSDVDIDTVRRLLLELWNAYQVGKVSPAASGEADRVGIKGSEVVEPIASSSTSLPTAPSGEGPTTASGENIPVAELGERLLAELEAGEAQGKKTEEIFERLEQMIGESEPGEPEDGPPTKIEWVTPDQGNLEALQREYLWERERLGKEVDIAAAKRLTTFVHSLMELGTYEVEKTDELALAKVVVHTWAQGDVQEVHDLMRDLVEWEHWLAEVQEIRFGISMRQFRDSLIEEARRLARIESEMKTKISDGKSPPILSWHVLSDPKGHWILESSHGRRSMAQDHDFVVGDLILGSLGEEGFQPGFRLLPRLLAQALTVPDTEDPS